MNPPPPVPDFQAPAPIIVAGQRQQEERRRGRTKIDAAQSTTPTEITMLPPPPTGVASAAAASAAVPVEPKADNSTDDSTNRERDEGGKDTERQHAQAESAEGETTRNLLPPPAKVALTSSSKAQGGGTGTSDYVPPTWGLESPLEATGLSLTVLKGGIEVNSISLDNRTHVLLGRQQGVVDVLLEHPSISRRHAILQHGQKGSLFLFDNGSTHGCSVNKNKIPPKEFHRLNVGDVLKFGESTRLYALEGPEELRPAEYESDNLRNLRLEAGRKQLALKLAKVKAGAAGGPTGDGGEYGISWGFDDDAVAEEDDEDGEEGMEGADGEVELPDYLKTEAQKRRRRDTKVGLTEDSVHKRDSKLFEKLQLKLTKVEHLLTENERITAKEGGQGGLTEGQQAQLVRNDKAVAGVRLQIEEIEETIRSKNQARERGKDAEGDGKSGGGGGGKDDESGAAAGMGDEDDDYYDRTAPVVPASARALEGGAISKKAEIRARRFGARDKTKKLVSPSAVQGAPTSSTAAVTGRGGAGSVPPFSMNGDGSAAQSLDALTRRAEAVGEDLARTESSLVELEVEEAEEAEEELTGGGGGSAVIATAVDPLDMFMSSNRKKERQQAILRLTTQRDSLRAERTSLKAMVEAARPAMPSLKARTSAPRVAAPEGPKGEDTSASDSSGGASPAVERHNSPEHRTADTVTSSGGKSSVGAGRDLLSEKGDAGAGKGQAKDMLPPVPASIEASSKASDPLERAAVTPTTMPKLAKTFLRENDGTNGGSVDEVNSIDKPPQEEMRKSSGVKRRGTPVGAAMLPPPPAKRLQQIGTVSPPANVERKDTAGDPSASSGSSGSFVTKPVMKGPAAMPPPTRNPSSSAEVADMSDGKGRDVSSAVAVGKDKQDRKSSRGKDVKQAAGKGALEGGDADWVPPKGQAGDGRTALNLKFGY